MQAIIHIIDDVLLPFPIAGVQPAAASFLSALRAAPDLAILVSAASIVAATVNPVLGIPNSKATVFAPTNEGFARGLEALGMVPDQLIQYSMAETIRKVLLYHVAFMETGALYMDDMMGGYARLPTLGESLACMLTVFV